MRNRPYRVLKCSSANYPSLPWPGPTETKWNESRLTARQWYVRRACYFPSPMPASRPRPEPAARPPTPPPAAAPRQHRAQSPPPSCSTSLRTAQPRTRPISRFCASQDSLQLAPPAPPFRAPRSTSSRPVQARNARSAPRQRHASAPVTDLDALCHPQGLPCAARLGRSPSGSVDSSVVPLQLRFVDDAWHRPPWHPRGLHRGVLDASAQAIRFCTCGFLKIVTLGL